MIISEDLYECVDQLIIDSEGNFVMERPVHENGKFKMVKTDHHTLILKLTNIPRRDDKVKRESKTDWNLNKEDGWKDFNENSNDTKTFERLNSEINKNSDNNKLVDILEKAVTKIKYKSFGKVQFKPNNHDKAISNLYAAKSNAGIEADRQLIDEQIAKESL